MGADKEIATEDDQPATLPAQADVLSELKLLRERGGITATKLSEKAPLILTLPIVDDQLALRRFDPRDRHLAAYSVIGCVLDHTEGFLARTLLILTLNYDFRNLRTEARPGWESVRRASSLTARHALIQGLVGYAREQYFEHLNRAYAEFANRLIDLERSPCRDHPPRGFPVTVAQQKLTLDALIGLFSAEAKDWAREALAREIVQQLPGGIEEMRQRGPSTTFRSRVLGALASGYGVQYARKLQTNGGRKRLRPLPPGEMLIDPGVLLRLFFESDNLHPIERFQSDRRLLRAEDLRTSYAALAEAMLNQQPPTWTSASASGEQGRARGASVTSAEDAKAAGEAELE